MIDNLINMCHSRYMVAQIYDSISTSVSKTIEPYIKGVSRGVSVKKVMVEKKQRIMGKEEEKWGNKNKNLLFIFWSLSSIRKSQVKSNNVNSTYYISREKIDLCKYIISMLVIILELFFRLFL